jgi:hypothetical protein
MVVYLFSGKLYALEQHLKLPRKVDLLEVKFIPMGLLLYRKGADEWLGQLYFLLLASVLCILPPS